MAITTFFVQKTNDSAKTDEGCDFERAKMQLRIFIRRRRIHEAKFRLNGAKKTSADD